MRHIYTIVLMLIVVKSPAQLLNANWKTTLAYADSNNIYPLGTVADNEGYIYVLSYVDVKAVIDDKLVTHNEGPFFLAKMYKNGIVTDMHSFGNNGFNDRCLLGIDNEGYVYIGGSFTGAFTYDDAEIAYANNIDAGQKEHHAFIMKLDRQGRPAWFREYRNKDFGIVTGMVFDKDNNLYAAIYYNDTMAAPFYHKGGSSSAIISLSPGGAYRWHKTFRNFAASGYTPLTMFTPDERCPQQFVCMVNTLDKFTLDNDIIYNDLTFSETEYLVQLTTTGTQPKYQKVYRSGSHTQGNILTSIKDGIYVAAIMEDSIRMNDGKQLTCAGWGTFVAAYDASLNFKDAKVLATSKSPFNMKKFQNLESKGLVLSVGYYDSFSLGSNYRSNSYSYLPFTTNAAGTVVVGVNPALTTSGMAYIDGTNVSINDIVSQNDEITYSAGHSGFDPVTGRIYNSALTLFRAPDGIKNEWPAGNGKKVLNYTVSPMPFERSCNIIFDKPVYGYDYNLYNAAGQLVIEARTRLQNSNTITVDMNGLSAGVYFIHLKDCCEEQTVIKLLKN